MGGMSWGSCLDSMFMHEADLSILVPGLVLGPLDQVSCGTDLTKGVLRVGERKAGRKGGRTRRGKERN